MRPLYSVIGHARPRLSMSVGAWLGMIVSSMPNIRGLSLGFFTKERIGAVLSRVLHNVLLLCSMGSREGPCLRPWASASVKET